MDPVTNSLKFPMSRPCNAGEECFLSYGNFSSSHLLTFYGFLPGQDNPYDVVPLGMVVDSLSIASAQNFYGCITWHLVYFIDIDLALEEDREAGGFKCDWNTHHMIRGTWFSTNHGIFNYGLPPPLLDHLRKARRGSTSRTETHVFYLILNHHAMLCYQ